MLVSVHSPLIDKLVILARGDVELVNAAIRANQQYRRWRWWQRKRWFADLADVVNYIVRKSNAS